MKLIKSDRGFNFLMHEEYPEVGQVSRVVSESSVMPHLWVGKNHHLDRRQVRILVKHLERWLETGSLRG